MWYQEFCQFALVVLYSLERMKSPQSTYRHGRIYPVTAIISKAPTLEARHRNVDYTCCIMKKGTMEGLLRHLNSVRLFIKFILLKWRRMESSPFSTPCSRGEMMTAWMSPSTGSSHTQTDTWTSSHIIHPMSRVRGLVRCLYDRARSITTRQDNLQKEECHLSKVLKPKRLP